VTNSMIIPAAIAYQNVLIENVRGLKEIGVDKDAIATPMDIINRLSKHLTIVKTSIDAMLEERKVTNAIEDSRDKAIAYDLKVKSYFDTIRYHADKLEQIVDDSLWPLPKFRELLFSK
jgi:glutamine synthetase